jgi:hypothetical protein
MSAGHGIPLVHPRWPHVPSVSQSMPPGQSPSDWQGGMQNFVLSSIEHVAVGRANRQTPSLHDPFSH